MGEGFRLGGPKLREHWEDLGVGGRITLSWTLGRQGWMGRNGFSCFRIGSSDGLYEHGDEPSGFTKQDIF
jgi:hypothetical protein